MPVMLIAIAAGVIGLVGGFTLSQGVSRAAWILVVLSVAYFLYQKGGK